MANTKQDMDNLKAELVKMVYVIGLVQFLAIVGSVLALINYLIDIPIAILLYLFQK